MIFEGGLSRRLHSNVLLQDYIGQMDECGEFGISIKYIASPHPI